MFRFDIFDIFDIFEIFDIFDILDCLDGSSGGYTYHGYTSHAFWKVSRNGRNAISPIYRHFWKVSINGRNVISPIYRHFWKARARAIKKPVSRGDAGWGSLNMEIMKLIQKTWLTQRRRVRGVTQGEGHWIWKWSKKPDCKTFTTQTFTTPDVHHPRRSPPPV